MEKLQYASYFGAADISDSEKERVYNEIKKLGGLSFAIDKNEDGWTAVCNEMPSIIAGNANPTPSDLEIETEIRSSIFAAFNVKESVPQRTSHAFEYSFAS